MLFSNRPRIGITKPHLGDNTLYFFTALNVILAGGKPVKITPYNDGLTKDIEGLILSGGRDINPKLYASEIRLQKEYDNDRDEMELALFAKASANNMPILGICRGAQMINVALGGNLIADVKLIVREAKYPKTVLSKALARKPVDITEGSMLYKIFNRKSIMVNILHHQSIDKLGEKLKITARESNGIVQAIEPVEHHKFLLGVQWHPELMIHSKNNRKIFKELIYAAKTN